MRSGWLMVDRRRHERRLQFDASDRGSFVSGGHGAVQPGVGEAEFPADGGDGDAHGFGDLFDVEAPEEAQLYGAGLAFVEGSEFAESVVEVYENAGFFVREDEGFIEGEFGTASTALGGAMAT